MRVSDPGHGADLALEALQETGQADELRRQDLDRDLLAAAALGDAAIHAAPRALAQLLDQSKPADLLSRQVADRQVPPREPVRTPCACMVACFALPCRGLWEDYPASGRRLSLGLVDDRCPLRDLETAEPSTDVE